MDYTPELPQHLKKIVQEDDTDDFCPQLPPHLSKKYPSENPDEFCPQLPSHLRKTKPSKGDEFCPQLPLHLQKNRNSGDLFGPAVPHNLAKDVDDEDEFCPALPVHLQPESKTVSHSDDIDDFCPALPHYLMKKETQTERQLGPSLPKDYTPDLNVRTSISGDSNSDDGINTTTDQANVYGPSPALEPVNLDKYIEDTIERRTSKMKDKISGKDQDLPPARESWMLELPEDRPLFSGLGLHARQFARKAKQDRGDTSVWTDTPADKERKAERAAQRGSDDDDAAAAATDEAVQVVVCKERDERLQRMVEEYNAKKRPAPLVDIHTDTKKARGDSTSVTGVGRDRKPFSRDDDLHVNKFDESQRATIIKKAKQLNDRFSSGKSAKFL